QVEVGERMVLHRLGAPRHERAEQAAALGLPVVGLADPGQRDRSATRCHSRSTNSRSLRWWSTTAMSRRAAAQATEAVTAAPLTSVPASPPWNMLTTPTNGL